MPPSSLPPLAASFPPSDPPRRLPWYHWRRLGFNFLTVSIAVHVLFLVAAAYYVVQTRQARHKLTFESAPKGPRAPTRALEHAVQMKKQKSMSAAPQARRVTTTGLSKISLPDMPPLPSMNAALSPGTISGMGTAGLAPGGIGGATGGVAGGGGGRAGFFGLRSGTGLAGTFYDLKQTPARQPTGMTPAIYGDVLTRAVRGGFNQGELGRFYKSPKVISTDKIFAPSIPAELGPASVGVTEVEPRLWCLWFKGSVIAPESGTFHFVGFGDDICLVKFNNKPALDACWNINTGVLPNEPHYKYDYLTNDVGFSKGPAFNVEKGQAYPIEVIVGEQPGLWSGVALLIEKEGETYRKDARGNPILPIFRMGDSTLPEPPPPGPNSHGYAPHEEGGPIWTVNKANSGSFSVFGH